MLLALAISTLRFVTILLKKNKNGYAVHVYYCDSQNRLLCFLENTGYYYILMMVLPVYVGFVFHLKMS